jgi:hypothetical protein
MPGLLADLSVAGKLFVRTLTGGHQQKIATLDSNAEFLSAMTPVLERLDPSLLSEYATMTMAASDVPWIDSGLSVTPGDEVSWFVCGRSFASKPLDIWDDPRTQVWAKIGDNSEVMCGTRLSHTTTAAESGTVKFGNYFPNDWADKSGKLLQDKSVYASMSGEVSIVVVRWAASAQRGLAALQSAVDYGGIVSSEIDRLQLGDTTPDGWSYLWNIGNAEIYRESPDDKGTPCIHCNTRADVGILQKDVELALTKDTALNWDWCIENLPSTLREDTVPSHDYLSIAVEFDNGRDITYYWSHNLAEGTGYDCPLPNWQGKEYHVVVRSGKKGLGQWMSESRNLYDDYQHYMGEPPQRIVRIWLIANSAFQRLPGDCTYANILLVNQDTEILVL